MSHVMRGGTMTDTTTARPMRPAHFDDDPPVRGIGFATGEATTDETVDAVRHRARRDERELQQLLGAQLVRVAGAAQR